MSAYVFAARLRCYYALLCHPPDQSDRLLASLRLVRDRWFMQCLRSGPLVWSHCAECDELCSRPLAGPLRSDRSGGWRHVFSRIARDSSHVGVSVMLDEVTSRPFVVVHVHDWFCNAERVWCRVDACVLDCCRNVLGCYWCD